MNILKGIVITAFVMSSAFTYGATIDFMSGDGNDICRASSPDIAPSDCSNTVASAYVDPTGTDLDGAMWLQTDGSYGTAASSWSVWERDFGNLTEDMVITSLFAAYDDDLIIKIGNDVMYTSDPGNWNQWATVTNVLNGAQWTVGAGEKLKFFVKNSHNGPTGVIWKGSATSVSEPGSLALLGLGIAGLGLYRRKQR